MQLNIHFKNGKECIEINGSLLDYVDLLEMASEMAYKTDKFEPHSLLAIVDLARMIAPEEKEISFLQQAVRELVLRNFKDSFNTEFDIHKLTEDKITKIIAESKVVKIKNDSNHQPDLWISVKNRNIPIEVKLNKFNSKALEQLERYMKFYGCDKGIAIGETLTTKLPKNIQFISIEELRDKSE